MMNTGMLWFDNDPKTDISTKLSRAANYYHQKYGKKPNLCFVHPSAMKDINGSAPEMEIKPNNRVKPHHLWLGIQELN